MPVPSRQNLNGIIPARAGFTRPPSSRPGAGRDHPRSRGVYRMRAVRDSPAAGSSPLARGLRVTPPAYRLTGGIIPARAGFTPPSVRPAQTTADHPRSRGVYPFSCPSSSRRAGSSPLARGLRCGGGQCPGLGRIIPARAGFTQDRGGVEGCGSDHPRSRGVYAPRATLSAYNVGSSPLARGLPSLPRC